MPAATTELKVGLYLPDKSQVPAVYPHLELPSGFTFDGEILRGPRSWSVIAPSMMPGNPPIPEPISTPVRSRFSASSGFQPESGVSLDHESEAREARVAQRSSKPVQRDACVRGKVRGVIGKIYV